MFVLCEDHLSGYRVGHDRCLDVALLTSFELKAPVDLLDLCLCCYVFESHLIETSGR